MQNIVADELYFYHSPTGIHLCGQHTFADNEADYNALSQGINIRKSSCSFGKFTLKNAYNSNMIAINNNFQHIIAINGQLANQLIEQKQQNITLQETLNQLRTELAEQKQQNVAFQETLNQLRTELGELNGNVSNLLSFIPRFVNSVSNRFLRLIGTVQQIEVLDELPRLEF